jgi:hypothetical protein
MAMHNEDLPVISMKVQQNFITTLRLERWTIVLKREES